MDYKWYIVNAVSGCENSVCKEINKLALTDDDIKEAFVPVKRVFKIVKGIQPICFENACWAYKNCTLRMFLLI